MNQVNNQYFSNELYHQIVASVPICTVDVLFFDPDLKSILLFQRTNEPLAGQYFAAGGRLFKNEQLLSAAVRQMYLELGLKVNPDQLWFGGVINEIFDNSAFPGINYHTLNTFFGYILDVQTPLKLDTQHSQAHWFPVDDPNLHLFMQTKIEQTLASKN